MERVYINVGKRDGFYAGNLIEMLNVNVAGKRVDVGRIDLMPGYSLFDVKKSDARRVVASLKGADFMGKRVFSEIASQDKDYAKVSQRRSKGKGKDKDEQFDPYDAFELFKKKAKKRK
jgi:ATP-dependent RNA helicase DeaD